MLTLSGDSGQTDIQRNSISDIPKPLFSQVHITEGVREKRSNNVIWNLGREFATACSQLQRYELNMRNVNLSMCGHGAFL